jgi:pimeloyl-ACP methyl ester carboxylesterase
MLVGHLLDYLKIEKAWLCGNSMGGEIALNVALVNPQRLAGLILIDSAGVKVSGAGSLAPGYLLLPVVGRVLTALALTPRGAKKKQPILLSSKEQLPKNSVSRMSVCSRSLPLASPNTRCARWNPFIASGKRNNSRKAMQDSLMIDISQFQISDSRFQI